jgi:hypothetical protein
MADILTGSCLCGAIRYSLSAPITELRVCHCTHCQKASGTGASVNAPLPTSAFKLTQGRLKRHTGKADSGRTLYRFFCGDCGSPIYSQRETAPETMVLRVGTLDNPGPMKITAHIWTRSARPWSHIDPSAKQFEGQPDAPAPKS